MLDTVGGTWGVYDPVMAWRGRGLQKGGGWKPLRAHCQGAQGRRATHLSLVAKGYSEAAHFERLNQQADILVGHSVSAQTWST